ncbi:hypothetical protein PGQ11_010890 [Apiospora arundinis]|uniref:Uncharacterized protein n=1 Tax=Apiospora arundinis TaxID=335852 RepID=A0ABR2IBJ5_9PEZI
MSEQLHALAGETQVLVRRVSWLTQSSVESSSVASFVSSVAGELGKLKEKWETQLEQGLAKLGEDQREFGEEKEAAQTSLKQERAKLETDRQQAQLDLDNEKSQSEAEVSREREELLKEGEVLREQAATS